MPILSSAVPPPLSGRVTWRQAAWRLAATVSDIQANGTVSLIHPQTKATLIATLASGNQGTFDFPFAAHGVILSPGFYWLEVARFIGGEHGAGVTLRTIIELTGGGWRSISGANAGDPLVISPLTTAVARVRAMDPTVTDQDTMGIVVPGNPLPAALGAHTALELQQLAAEVDAAVTAGSDGAGDLPLPVTLSPLSGTAGITSLNWNGLTFSPDQIRQVASGSDVFGQSISRDGPTIVSGSDHLGEAPDSVVGAVQLRLHTGSSRTLPVTWTALGATPLAADVGKVTAGAGPAGPHAVWWSATDNLLRTAPLAATSLGAVTVIGPGGSGIATTSPSATEQCVLTVVGGAITEWRAMAGVWTGPTAFGTGANAASPKLADDGAGGVWAAWLDDATLPRAIRVSHYTGGSWGPPDTVGGNTVESFDLSGGATPQLAWSEATAPSGRQVQHSKYVTGAWIPATALSDLGSDSTSVAMAVSPAGDAHVAWVADTSLGVSHTARHLVFRAFGSGVWQPQEIVYMGSIPYAAQPRVCLSPGGFPVLLWFQGDFRPLLHLSRRLNVPTVAGPWKPFSVMDSVVGTDVVGADGSDRYWALWRMPTTSSLRGLPVVW